jgi:uncharacterized protein with von Willebrand factor type A (vWA) domain
VITQEKMEAALAFLAQTDTEIAESKMRMAKSEYLAKLREAFSFKESEGETVKDREAQAKTTPECQAAWEVYFVAVAEYEKLRAKRERAVLTIDLFRTLEASRRQGGQIT